jgi:hypothetical protein
MEGFKPQKNNGQKKESILNKVSNFAKAVVLSKKLDNSKLDETLANNLYTNRILEEERIAPDKSFRGVTPSLPEGTKIIDVYGSYYANIGDKMYYIRKFKGGFDLVDNTRDFIPDSHFGSRMNRRRFAFLKKHGLSLSDATEAIPRKEFYHYDESISDLDNWIIHNDMGQIKKNRFNKDETWWQKGEPYKAMEERSLIKDKPTGRHLFVKQSALEDSIGRPLDEHRELIGDVMRKGNVQDGGLTITPTSEADLSKIKDLKSFTYNPITKSMEKGIFHNPDEPKDKSNENKNLDWPGNTKNEFNNNIIEE